MKRLHRIDRILQAQARVILANELLTKLSVDDSRFAGALDEYRDALEDRKQVERHVR
jgi:hypothetical protein